MHRKKKKEIEIADWEREFLNQQNIYSRKINKAQSAVNQFKKIINQKFHA